MSNENEPERRDLNNLSDECELAPDMCSKCDGRCSFDGWDLPCECSCHIPKPQFQETNNAQTSLLVKEDKKEQIPIPLKVISLNESRTETDAVSLFAKIDEIGNLVLEGYDIGETPKNFWGKDEYEYWLTINKKYKDSILLLLIKDRFNSDTKFKQWLDERGIPSEFYSWL